MAHLGVQVATDTIHLTSNGCVLEEVRSPAEFLSSSSCLSKENGSIAPLVKRYELKNRIPIYILLLFVLPLPPAEQLTSVVKNY